MSKLINIKKVKQWFEVLLTTNRSQIAVMKLGPGQSSCDEPESHKHSEQILFLVKGELSSEIAGKHSRMEAGDFVVISPRVKHKFTNTGSTVAITFNVYSPPEYPPHQKG